MSSKALVIVSSGLSEKEKALTGFAYARNVKRNHLLDDVKVVLFGPSEKAVASGDMDFVKGVRTLMELGVIPVACSVIAKIQEIEVPLGKEGVQLENVGPVISNYIKEGYQVISF